MQRARVGVGGSPGGSWSVYASTGKKVIDGWGWRGVPIAGAWDAGR